MEPIQTPELTQQLEQQAWKLRIEGCCQQHIAEELGLDQSTVSRMLQRVRARLAAEFTLEALQMRLEQTEQLLYIAGEAVKAWKEARNPVPPNLLQSLR